MMHLTKPELLEAVSPYLPGYYPCAETCDQIVPVDMVTVTAPRGMGKDTIRNKTGYPTPRAFTTREPREGEIEDNAYDFVEENQYTALIDAVRQRQFVQLTSGIGGNDLYGTSPSAYPDEGPAILDLVHSQIEVIRKLPFRTVTNIYLTAPDEPTWMARFRGRGPMDEQTFHSSLLEARDSLEWALTATGVTFVLNDTVDQAVKDVRTVVERPDNYQRTKHNKARNAAAGILRSLKVELGGRPLVV